MARAIDILFADDVLMAVNKPAGALTIPGRRSGEAIRELLARQGVTGELLIVHRLDRQTSGVLLLARAPEAHQALSGQFARRRVEKSYLALVQGHPEADEGLIDAPLARDPHSATRMIVHARLGKPSRTRWEIVERFAAGRALGGIALLRCRPLTGRQHQIRVHLVHAGMPLLVDGTYGRREEFLLSTVKPFYRTRRGEVERPLMARLTLHAEALGFEHPVTHERVRVEAPLPKDFKAVLTQLRKSL